MSKETKRERFHRIAAKRVENIIKEMNRLSNCSNRATYDYSDDDIKKITSVINDKFLEIKISFRKGINKSNKFNF